jgi:hypothetical protein
LQIRWHRDHQSYQLALDGNNFVFGQLVVAILVDPVSFYEVLEVESAGEPCGLGSRVGGDDVEEGEGEAGLCLLLSDCCLRWDVLVLGSSDGVEKRFVE